MEHELIDLLNEKGEKIGVVDKYIAHRDGLWHRSVHVWIVNDNNQILLQQRCAKKKFFPNLWDCSFAGHVGADEDSIISVIREGKEEIGIEVDISKLKYLFTYKEKLEYGNIKSNEFVDVYLLRVNIKINDLVYQEIEVSGAKYLDINEFFRKADDVNEGIFQHKEEYKRLKKILK